MATMSFYDYRAMVEDTPIETFIVEFRDPDDRLVGACLTDRLGDGLSAVYSFFAPGLEKRSLGTYTILWLIERARRLGLPYVYLGYWVPESRKMAYKSRFRPSEILIGGTWRMMTDADMGDGGEARKWRWSPDPALSDRRTRLAALGARNPGDGADRAGIQQRPLRHRTLRTPAPPGRAHHGRTHRRARRHASRRCSRRDRLRDAESRTCAARCSTRRAASCWCARSQDERRWTLPGGWADVNQTPAESVRARGVRGIRLPRARSVKLAAVWDRARQAPPAHGVLDRRTDVSSARWPVGRQHQPGNQRLGWFAEADIPEDLSRGRTLPHQIARMFAHWRQPELPTD